MAKQIIHEVLYQIKENITVLLFASSNRTHDTHIISRNFSYGIFIANVHRLWVYFDNGANTIHLNIHSNIQICQIDLRSTLSIVWVHSSLMHEVTLTVWQLLEGYLKNNLKNISRLNNLLFRLQIRIIHFRINICFCSWFTCLIIISLLFVRNFFV